MARIAITGVTGFVGSNLAKKLVQLGHTVFGVTRHCASRDLRELSDLMDKIVLLTADIGDAVSLSQAIRCADPDVVCHTAALTPVRLSFERPFEFEKANYLGTMNVVHAMMELPDFKRRKLVAASTAEVYGIHTVGGPLKEEDRLNPSSPYAVSKAAADLYLLMAARVYDLNAVILRPVNTYGRKLERGFIVEYLISSMLQNERTYIGAPESIREYMHIDDHVNGYICAIEKGRSGEAYNLSTMHGISNKDLALTIAEKVGYDVDKVKFGAYPPGYPLRPLASDQPFIILDNSKARTQLKWLPEVALDQGIDRSIGYWKSEKSR